MSDVVPTPGPLGPPDARQRSRELLIGRDVVRLMVRAPWLGSLPRGDGGPVMLTPGFGATDQSLALLGRFLRSRGHDVRAAGLGRVSDDVRGLTRRLMATVDDVARTTGRPVAMVGWSIGGVLSREVAREQPALVSQVITLGTPVVGGPSYTALAGRYPPEVRAAVREVAAARDARPITVPITAVWSPNDGVVSARACIDRVSPNCRHVRVTSTHIGMGFDPDVWAIVAKALAG